MKLLTLCVALLLALPAAAEDALTQKLDAGDKHVITDDATLASVTQSGKIKPYTGAALDAGLHFNTGGEVTVTTDVKAANSISTTLLGVHGKDTHIRYTGRWAGDASGGYPILVLTDGGKMTWEAEARVDFVMASNFFTRQLWVEGDGTGTLELAEGFVSDRTQDATVPDAMGTIRLGGATLITHHSHSLPYNSRPDGRGGIYHNGHIVFEQRPGSTWVVKTNQHHYAAQIDFDIDGTIDCQAPLTHHGQRRVCLPVGNGGPFISTGAFRTTAADVTITKTGPAMLSLEGQQAYRPGSKLVIKDGLVRFHSDPGAGGRVDEQAGPHLRIEVMPGGKLHFATPLSRVHSIHLHDGATMTQEDDAKVEAVEGITKTQAE